MGWPEDKAIEAMKKAKEALLVAGDEMHPPLPMPPFGRTITIGGPPRDPPYEGCGPDCPGCAIHRLEKEALASIDAAIESQTELVGAAREAFGALVGAHASDDSVQGRARKRLRAALGIGTGE